MSGGMPTPSLAKMGSLQPLTPSQAFGYMLYLLWGHVRIPRTPAGLRGGEESQESRLELTHPTFL